MSHPPENSGHGKSRRVSDSVILGGVAFTIAAVGVVVLALSGWRSSRGLPANIGMSSLCGAPLIAFMNLYFVLREKDRGQGEQAALGASLSGGALVLSSIPWMGVD